VVAAHVAGRPDQTILRFPPRKRAGSRRPGLLRPASLIAAGSSSVVCFRGKLHSALAFAAPGALPNSVAAQVACERTLALCQTRFPKKAFPFFLMKKGLPAC
jgi:hypothetical protein